MPKNLQTHCPHCNNVCVYRATSVGREMRCQYCGLLFRRPTPQGIPLTSTIGGVGMLVVFLLCGGCLYLGGWLRPGPTTASTQVEQSKDDKPKTTTQKQQEDTAQKQKEDMAKRAKQAEEKREEMRRAQEEAKRKAEEKKTEERAAAFLRYAKKLADKGQTDIAKERLQDIVRDMPKTEAAKEARQLLEKLTP